MRALGLEFRSWRESWELEEERQTHGYATERRSYREDHAPPTFGRYLIAMTGSGWPMSGSRP